MAGKINEWTEGLLVELVVTIVDDVDRNARVAESIRQVSDAAFLEELAKLPLGKHTVTGTQKLQLLQSYSSGPRPRRPRCHRRDRALDRRRADRHRSGRRPRRLHGLQHLQEPAPDRLRQPSSGTWMNEEINRGQFAISSGYERAMIDVQDKMREAMRVRSTTGRKRSTRRSRPASAASSRRRRSASATSSS